MQGATERTKILTVLGHGRSTGLCHHLFDVVREILEQRGVSHRSHDLLADGFDPVLRLASGEPYPTSVSRETDPLVHQYQEDVRWADAYIVVHPVWWLGPPAILKGWVERVLVHDVAIRQRPGETPEALLQGRRALLVQSFNSGRAMDRVFFGGLAERFWRTGVFRPVGVRRVKRFALYSASRLSQDRLRTACLRLRKAVTRLVSEDV